MDNNDTNNQNIEISKKELLELLSYKAKFIALESGGVDNWDCYEFIMRNEYPQVLKSLKENFRNNEILPN